MYWKTNLTWLWRRGLALALVFGYLVLALVIAQQARTIASQQKLIHQLFQDSLELTALRLQQHAQGR